ncbi:MAG: menaquinone biosynthesis decarboxylase [Bacteroidetes bacterium]|nr:menaquinone biosynthesis decarboxylase [Bacteroidota bacterium]MCL5025867.1 menaquinone biosynthesis decarboxylase [Chloroflexota bacterium]
MAFRDLREFISTLEQRGQLRRIATEVSADLEITEITDRVVKQGGPALLFENVVGHSVPVLMNMFGTAERMAWSLGVERLDELTERISHLLQIAQSPLPASMMDKLKLLGDLSELVTHGPKTIGRAPCQEVVRTDDASLEALPILRCWPEDGGRYITLPLVITRDPATGKRNVGMYRMQVFDARTAGMHWHIHKDAASHYRASEEEGQRLPVAVALGADPAVIYAATAPLPAGIDELMFAGFLRKQSVEVVHAKTVDLEVPAHAEIVLEGYVDPAERRTEGPFGDHTGYYSLADQYPVFHLTAVTHRADPIYPATVVGRPPMEDGYLGKATERLFLPLIKMLAPEVVEINLPVEGAFNNLAIVSIRKTYPGQARKVMSALWGMGQMMLTKTIVVLDADANVHDLREVLWRVTANIDPRRDLVVIDGPLDALDHASPYPRYGAKLGIDATVKGPDEGQPRPWPDEIVMSPEIKRLVDQKWTSYGL